MARPSSLYNDLHKPRCSAAKLIMFLSKVSLLVFSLNVKQNMYVRLRLPLACYIIDWNWFLAPRLYLYYIRSSDGFNAPVKQATVSPGISGAWTTLGLNCCHCPIIRVLATFSLPGLAGQGDNSPP